MIQGAKYSQAIKIGILLSIRDLYQNRFILKK
jgi:hypothetical protein